MAKVEYTHNESLYLTEISVNGCLSVEEIIHYSEKFYKRYSSPLVIWDARKAAYKPFTEEDVQRVALSLKDLAKSRPAGKTAFVCKNDTEISDSNLFSNFSIEAGAKISYQTFIDFEEAKSWLIDDNDDDFELRL